MKQSLLFTAAIAGLIMGAQTATASGSEKVVGECHGVNSCKGKSACAGESNSCKGQNSCKGKGWVKMDKEKCDKKKGTFKEMAKM